MLKSKKVQARYYLPTGEQVTAGTFDTVEQAQDRLDEIEVDLRRGAHWDGRKGTVERQVTGLGRTTDTKTGQHKTIHLLSPGIAAIDRLPTRIGATALVPGARAARMPRISLQRAWARAVAVSVAGVPGQV